MQSFIASKTCTKKCGAANSICLALIFKILDLMIVILSHPNGSVCLLHNKILKSRARHDKSSSQRVWATAAARWTMNSRLHYIKTVTLSALLTCPLFFLPGNTLIIISMFFFGRSFINISFDNIKCK